MKKARSFIALAAVGVILLTGATPKAFAQSSGESNGQGNGLKISPVRNDLTIEKGSSRQVNLYLENITAFPLNVRGVTNDFIPSDDESSEPRIILDDKESAPGNSFKTLVGAIPSVRLEPNERREIRIILSVPEDAESGGYYGAIRFSPNNGETDQNVSLTASVGTIFLVKVPGNITEQMKVESFRVANEEGHPGSLFNSGPISVQTRFRNSGNIHLLPFGKITLKNFSGKVLEEFEFNNVQPRGSVLPNSVRKFEDKFKQEKYFGRYTVEGNFGYGDKGELIMAKKTFYVIPFKLIAAVIFGLAFLIFILPKIIRAYNQSIIRRAQSSDRGTSAKTNTKRANPKPNIKRRR